MGLDLDEARLKGMLKPRGNMCKSDEKRIAAHQIVAAKIAKSLVSGPERGVLLWHSTGSGKTCTAAAMMESVWDSKLRIVYLTNVEASVANDVCKIAECAHTLGLQRWKGRTLKEVYASFDKRRVEMWTFAKLAHHLQLHRGRQASSDAQAQRWKKYLRNTFLVVDEAHSLLEASAGQSKEYDALYTFLADTSNDLQQGLKIVLMTATPGDSVEDVTSLMNLIRRPGSPLLQWGTDTATRVAFCERIMNNVSYFDYSSDMSRFPKLTEVVHQAPMSKEQALEIVRKDGKFPGKEALAAMVEQAKENSFWKVARAYSNTLFNYTPDMTLDVFSPKIAMLLQTIRKFPDEKHFVYSAFHERRGYGGHGARAIVKALKASEGYEDFEGGKRTGTKAVAIISGSNEVTETVKAFNDPGNDRGDRIHVMVATQRYNEGIDLKSVRHIHVFEPLINHTADLQVQGRAVRMCSHSGLDFEKDWTVTMHRYFSKPPDVEDEMRGVRADLDSLTAYQSTMDQEIDVIKGKGSPAIAARKEYLRAIKGGVEDEIDTIKDELAVLEELSSTPAVDTIVYEAVKDAYKDTATLLHALKEVAIDCEVFREFHLQSGKDIACKHRARA